MTVPAMETKGKYILRDNRHAAAVFIATHPNAALRSRGSKDAAKLMGRTLSETFGFGATLSSIPRIDDGHFAPCSYPHFQRAPAV